MRLRILSAAALGLVVVLVATACAEIGGNPASAIDGPWQLESGTVHGEPVPLVDGYRITLIGTETSFGGTAACNGYGGSFAVEAGQLSLHEFNITEMACLPDVMASEAAYVAGIQRVDRAVREGDRLVLSGPDVELEFAAVAPVNDQDVIGTIWVLEGLIAGESVTTVQGENLTLDFNEDGTLVALTGCRILTGTHVIVGDEIVTPELSAEGECSSELQAQDSHVVTVFEGGFTVTIDGDRLTLTAAGNDGLAYRADL